MINNIALHTILRLRNTIFNFICQFLMNWWSEEIFFYVIDVTDELQLCNILEYRKDNFRNFFCFVQVKRNIYENKQVYRKATAYIHNQIFKESLLVRMLRILFTLEWLSYEYFRTYWLCWNFTVLYFFLISKNISLD